MSVIIKGPSRQQNVSFLNTIDDDNGVTVNPGDVITADSDFMRGHGTYQEMLLYKIISDFLKMTL